MNESITYFITWTTYGAWLPGDARGWKKRDAGLQPERPFLEAWSREQLAEPPVLLTPIQRAQVEAACQHHSLHRNWELHAIAARSNHVHLAVTCNVSPRVARNQFKANATRALREGEHAPTNQRVWTTGGDAEIVDSDEELERVILYITTGQDRPRQ